MNNTKRAVLAIALIASAVVAYAALPNPSTYFSFDSSDGSTVSDLSGSGRNLTIGSGAYVTNLAAVGNALWFDGTENAWASFSPPVVTNRTISFWYWRNCDPGPYFAANWNSGSNTSNNSMPTLISGLGTLNFRFGNQWEDSSNQSLGLKNKQVVPYFGAISAVYMPTNTKNYAEAGFCRWVHYALTFNVKSRTPNGNNLQDVVDCAFYVNGEKVYEIGNQVTYNCVNGNLARLGNIAGNLRPCCGALDEFRVFDSVLSESEIREEFARGANAQKQRLVAWYPLQEFSAAAVDGSFTTPDKTDYGIANGTVMTCSSETSVVPGPGGNDHALHFQGTSDSKAETVVPWPVDDFTVSAWVNVSTNTTIIRIPGQSANYPPFFRYGNAYVSTRTAIADTSVGYRLPGGSDANITDGKGIVGKGNWQHITWVVRNVRELSETSANSYRQKLEVYLNGEYSTEGAETSSAATARNTALYLGWRGATRVFEGDMSDFRLYDGAMSADDVRRLFCGAAAVDAGGDATVKGATAVLCGSVAAKSADEIRTGYAGEVTWSLVSAPAGAAAGVAFARPANPVTEVTLPAEGTYVFKLATKGYIGATSEDTVTIVRDDANGTASVVPAVDVEAVASNALVAASLSDGLVRNWNFNGLVKKELVSDALFGIGTIDWSKIWITNGVTGSAFMNVGGRGCALDTGLAMNEPAATENHPPAGEWYSVSAWIRPDADSPEDWYSGVIMSVPDTLFLCYGKWTSWNSNNQPTGVIEGFSIQQKGISGAQSWMDYDMPSGTTFASLAGGWHHVAMLVNRKDTSKSEFYLDGIRLDSSSTSKTGSYSGLGGDYAQYNGTPWGGRYKASNHIYLCNFSRDWTSFNNNVESNPSNKTTNVAYSRLFPGAVDEVRCYTNKLSAVQIGYLAANPDPFANDAPAVGGVSTSENRFVKHEPETVSVQAADDGNPNGVLNYEWLVTSGDSSRVEFADASAPETTVTISEKGSYTFVLKVSDGERVTYSPPKTIYAQGPGMFIIFR